LDTFCAQVVDSQVEVKYGVFTTDGQ